MSENPFAPTPIGKDWTPPQPPVIEEPAGLGDLFSTEVLEGTTAPGSAEVAQEAEPPPGGGLSDLFGDTAAETPSEQPGPQPTTIRPKIRRVPGERIDPAASTPAAPAAPVTPVAEHTPQTAQAPAGMEPAPRREIRTAAKEAPRTPALSPQENERLWNFVDQATALIGGDTELQRVIRDMELTRDPEVHHRQWQELSNALRPRMADARIAVSGTGEISLIMDRVLDEITGISVLGDLWRDPSVTEILVDRWDIISVERDGRLERTGLTFRNPQHAESTARSLALKISDRAVSRSIPLVTAELPDARVTFAFGAVVKGGLSVTIRKFRDLLDLSDLLAYQSLDQAMVAFLRSAVRARASILVSGGTGTGKTTIINLLSTFIPDTERVVTIEDAFELKLANTHVVSLQTKEAASRDDTVAVTLAQLLRNTLRMRPDRIIVGEIREGEGALVMLAAANTGHDGTITTIHANSADAALNERLPDLVREERPGSDDGAIMRSVAGAFDLVLQVVRSRSGRRYISEISLVTGVRDGRIATEALFTAQETPDGVVFLRHPARSETEILQHMSEIEEGGNTWTD